MPFLFVPASNTVIDDVAQSVTRIVHAILSYNILVLILHWNLTEKCSSLTAFMWYNDNSSGKWLIFSGHRVCSFWRRASSDYHWKNFTAACLHRYTPYTLFIQLTGSLLASIRNDQNVIWHACDIDLLWTALSRRMSIELRMTMVRDGNRRLRCLYCCCGDCYS